MHGERSFLVRINARPDALYTSQGRTVLATDAAGRIDDGNPEVGLWVHETRLLSKMRWLIGGELPQPVTLSNVEQHSWLGYYITFAPGVERGKIDTGSGMVPHVSKSPVELRVARYVGEGIHEDIDVTNFAGVETEFLLELELAGDFRDLAEKAGRMQQGEIETRWDPKDGRSETLEFLYRAEHHYDNQEGSGTRRIFRGLRLVVRDCDSAPQWTGHSLAFPVKIAPHQTFHVCLDYHALIENEVLSPLYGCRSFFGIHNEYDKRRQMYLDESTVFEVPGGGSLSNTVANTLEQAKRDLAALRLYDLDVGPRAWTLAAGLPIYVALFGRDTLTASWQAAPVTPDIMKGTLPVLACFQGKETNDWLDERPGRMIHEMHTGPLEALNFNARRRSYGSITTSGLYAFMLSELWHWTGDRDLVRPLITPALDALAWLDRDADHNGDGFYDYLTRSEDGVKHQAWKDSPDAIVDEHGNQIDPPIATCEEQGFAYIAKLHISEVLWWMGQRSEAKEIYRQAADLKKRFNEKFWIEDLNYLALGLDAEGRQIRSITSNPGHCIATAILDSERVERVAKRMFEEDLFTGWGFRSLSNRNPAYNPYSYHLGPVWPVEHGTFALGFMRYGLHEMAQKVARAQFEAASLFDFYRLPELFSGHARDESHPFPAMYPNANAPQAWSASSVFSLIQAMLGIYPYAPLKMMLVDPHLPEWLPEITLRQMELAGSRISIRFFRKSNGDSDYEILEKDGRLHVLRQATPWSLTTTYPERLKDWLGSLRPGK